MFIVPKYEKKTTHLTSILESSFHVFIIKMKFEELSCVNQTSPFRLLFSFFQHYLLFLL